MKNNIIRNLDDDELCARFTSWVEIIAHRAKLDYFKSQKYRLHEISIELIDGTNNNDEIQQFDKCEFVFQDSRLAEAFNRLPSNQQRIVTLRFAKGLSSAEIAEVVGYDSAKVSRQLYKALSKIRLRLLREVGTDG